MADAPTPAARPILPWLHQEYITLVEQLNINIPDYVENVKSLRPTFQSLDLSTRDLEMRSRDLRAASLLHMFFVMLWTWVSPLSKSQITSGQLSPMQHLAAIHEDSKNLKQEIDRCLVKCQQLMALPALCVPWGSEIEMYLVDGTDLLYIKGPRCVVLAALQPYLSASGDDPGDDDEDYIKSFHQLSDSLQDTNRKIKCYFWFIKKNLCRTSCDTDQLAKDCEHLKAFSSSCWFFGLKSKLLQLESLQKKIKVELAEAIDSIEFLNKVAERLIELQKRHHIHSQKLVQRTLFSQDHLAAIIQMRHDLDAINNPRSDSANDL